MSGLPLPIEMPDPLPVNSKVFDLAWPQLITPVGSGFVQTIDRGPNLWSAKYTTPPMYAGRDNPFQDFLDQLNGSQNTFLGFDPRRPLPYAYRTAGSGTPWNGSAGPARVTATNFTNSQLSLDQFAAGAILTSGDYISFQFGSIWRLYRVVLGPYTADSSGVMSPVNVVPRPQDTISAPITLRLRRAACAMKVVGAVQKNDQVTDLGPVYTFSAAQFVDRSSMSTGGGPGPGGLTSADGVTWSAVTAIPSWVTTYWSVPSGNTPYFVFDIVNSRFYIDNSVLPIIGGSSLNPSTIGPAFYHNTNNGPFDPTLDWINGTGLQANTSTGIWPTICQNLFLLYPNVTMKAQCVGTNLAASRVYFIASDNPDVNSEFWEAYASTPDYVFAESDNPTTSNDSANINYTDPVTVAMTCNGPTCRVSANGSAVQSVTKLTYTVAFTYMTMGLQKGGGGTATIQGIAFYPPQPDTDLPTIS